MATATPEHGAAAPAAWRGDLVAGAVVSLVALSFYISAASLIFQGALTPYLAGAIGCALSGGALMALFQARGGSLALAAVGAEPATVPVLAGIAAGVAAALGPQAAPATLLASTLAALAVAALAVGACWWAIGRIGAGELIRYIPYPVIGGFLASIGWLMVTGGLAVASGHAVTPAGLAPLLAGADAPATERLLTALGIGLLLWWGATRIRHVLFLPAAILLLSLALHARLALAGLDLEAARRLGWLMAGFERALPHQWLAPAHFAAIDWAAVAAQAGLLASAVIVSAIGLLLSIGSLEVAYDEAADVNRDLRVLGLANLACGLGGGLLGGVSISRSLLNQAAGARGRGAGVVKAGVCVAAMGWGGPVIAAVPKPMLGGLLAFIGLGMLKTWLVDSRARLARPEFATVLAMVAVTAVLGFLAAVCVGVLSCCVDFAVSSARLAPVRRLLPRSAWPAKVEYAPWQLQRLAEAGARACIVELQGVLFFGSVTRLVARLEALLQAPDRPTRLLLDFEHVPWIDSSAAQGLARFAKQAAKLGATLQFSGLKPPAARALRATGALAVEPFADVDAAVRAWDDDWLQVADGAAEAMQSDAWLAAELGSAQRAAALLARFETLDLAPGQALFAQGDPPDALYLVRRGRLTASVARGDEQVEVRTVQAGSAVGEMGLFRATPRSATLRAALPSQVLRLGRDELERLEREAPAQAQALYRLLIRQLAGRLEQASAQANALTR